MPVTMPILHRPLSPLRPPPRSRGSRPAAGRRPADPDLRPCHDPTADEQYAMEWLNAPAARSGRDPGMSFWPSMVRTGCSPPSCWPSSRSPRRSGGKPPAAMALAEADGAAFPTPSAISAAPLVFYPLFNSKPRPGAPKRTCPRQARRRSARSRTTSIRCPLDRDPADGTGGIRLVWTRPAPRLHSVPAPPPSWNWPKPISIRARDYRPGVRPVPAQGGT